MSAIYHQVWINAPIAKVYWALSTVEGVNRWWEEQTAVQTEEGLVFEHSPGPVIGVVRMKVNEMVPNIRVEWECISTHDRRTPAFAWTGTRLIFEMMDRKNYSPANVPWTTDVPAMTILDFRQTGWDENNEYFGFCNYAWGIVLQKLALVCESSP
jgi:uncharacterized protein YndB with AHSA1/START domain